MLAILMAKRIAILSGLVVAALLTGLLGAQLLGGPFVSRKQTDDRAITERYALGRDIYRPDDYAVATRYDPYNPGQGRIASPSVRGARPIEPYEAARPDHRIAFSSEDGNFMEATGLPESDYAMIDPPVRRQPKPASAKPAAGGPENLLPGGYVRTERPYVPQPRSAPTPSVAPAKRADPVADTERRIIDIAGARTAASDGADGAADDTPADSNGPSIR